MKEHSTDNKNKRVLFLRTNPVDPDPRVEKEANTLLGAGYSVDIFCWDRSSNHGITHSVKKLPLGDCDIYRVGIAAAFSAGFKKNIRPLMRFQMEILRFLRANGRRYNILHACDFDTALVGYVGSGKRHIKFVYDIFDYYADAFSVPRYLKKIIIALDTYVINHADAVILCSEKRKAQLGKVEPKRLAVVHNSPAIHPELGETTSEKSSSQICIAYIGILSDGRLIPELLDVVSNNKDYKLLIAGFGKYEDMVSKYADCNENIKFFGRVDYSRTLEIESESDVMIAAYDPSVSNHIYAAPNKFYEALMLGKPLIMCKGTGFSETIEENGIGISISYSKEALEEGLELINKNYNLYKSRSDFEKELFRKEYSWKIMGERLVSLYSKL